MSPNGQSSRKGKERETHWTPWEWDERGFYASARTGLDGQDEWRYASENELAEIDQRPRYVPNLLNPGHPGHQSNISNSSNSGPYNQFPLNQYTNPAEVDPDPDATGRPGTVGSTSAEHGSHYQHHPSALEYNSGGQPNILYGKFNPTTTSYNNSNLDPAYNNQQFQRSSPPSTLPWNQRTSSLYQGPTAPQSLTSTLGLAGTNVQNIAHDFSRLNVGGQSQPKGNYPQDTYDGHDVQQLSITRHFTREEDSKSYEQLDPRYKEIEPANWNVFWQFGRVFKMLWTEPAGSGNQHMKPNTHLSEVAYGETAASYIRHFVVLKKNWGNVICIAVHTYGGQGTLKPNLPDPQDHALIYTDDYPPSLLSGEWLTRDPIKVDRDDEGDELHVASRLHYTKLYTVEMNCRVLSLGMVSRNSIPSLTYNSPLRSADDAPPPARPAHRSPHHKKGRPSGSRPDKKKKHDKNPK